MGKPNTYLQLRAAQQQIQQLQRDIWMSKGFTIQQCLDIAQIALHEEFGFGPTYQSRFGNAFRKAFVEYAERISSTPRAFWIAPCVPPVVTTSCLLKSGTPKTIFTSGTAGRSGKKIAV